MWSFVVVALSGALTVPASTAGGPAPFGPTPFPESCVLPALSAPEDPCHGHDPRDVVSCVVPVVFRGSLVTCRPERPPESSVVPVREPE